MLQHVLISIQIIFRELVVSSLKSPSLKLLKIWKVHYGNVAAYMWCVCMVFCVEMHGETIKFMILLF